MSLGSLTFDRLLRHSSHALDVYFLPARLRRDAGSSTGGPEPAGAVLDAI